MNASRSPRSQAGSTLLGAIVGFVAGLAVALLIAIYITNAPVPFVNKVQRPNDTGPVPGADGKLPDPNRPLYGAAPPTRTEPPKAPPVTEAPKAEAKAAAPAKSEPEASRYLLQAGAFKTPDDADAMRARLALLGLDARIFPIEQGGATLYRVRVGPYGSIEDINRIRKVLAENNIDAQIVRLK